MPQSNFEPTRATWRSFCKVEPLIHEEYAKWAELRGQLRQDQIMLEHFVNTVPDFAEVSPKTDWSDMVEWADGFRTWVRANLTEWEAYQRQSAQPHRLQQIGLK